MPKSFSVNRNQVAVFSTVLVLIFLGASYFFIYVPDNEKTVQERRFLCLQNIDKNIHSKIENSASMLNSLLTAYPENSSKKKPDSLKKLNKLKKYVESYSKKNFTLLFIDSLKAKEKKSLIEKDSLVTINTDPNSQQFTLYISRIIKGTSDSVTMGIRYRFEQFVKPLLTADVFDNYIVFINYKKNAAKGNDKANNNDKPVDNKIVYETFPSGLSYRTKDSLLAFKNGITSPGIRSLSVGGTDYKVFSQPVNVGADSEWIIVGLISDKNYQKEKDQLPLWVVLLLLTTAIGIIVSLPWIKLYHMGNKDKLTVKDGIASVLVSMLLMSLLFFVIFKYSFHFSSSYARFSSPRNLLAAKVTKAFTTELDTAYHRLSTFDSIYNNLNVKTDIINLGKSNPTYNKEYKGPKYDTLLKNTANGIAIDQIFWLDKNGVEQNNWTSDSIYTPLSNLSSRDYFKRVMSKKTYRSGPNEFYLEQVISRSTGIFTSVLSINSLKGKAKVAAMSFTMPDGYQVAIIDEKGEVLYHSLADRNLNENLINEFADSTALVSSIEAKSDTSFNAEYYGRQYEVKIKPIPGLPYFTVIFEDQEYNDARDTEAYVFTLSMLICLVIFLVIQMGIVFFVSAKRSLFKKQRFETSWVGPKKSSHRQYNIAIIGNLVIIILLIAFFKNSSFLKYLYILLFSIAFVGVFLNGIFAISYYSSSISKFYYKIKAIIALFIFFVLLDYIACQTLEPANFWSLILYEFLLTGTSIILICIYLVCYYRVMRLLAKAAKYKAMSLFRRVWTYTNSFALMTTTRLVITSGIPVAFFFIYAFNYEQNLDMRYRQLNFARSLTQKVHFDETNVIGKETLSNKKSVLNFQGVYYDGLFIKDIKDSIKSNPLHYSNEDLLTVEILSAVRLLMNNIELKSNNLNFPTVGTEAVFNSLLREHAGNHYNTITNYQTGLNTYIRLRSDNNSYPAPSLIFWFLLIVLIFIFCYIIDNIIRKLFALDLPLNFKWEKIDERILLNSKLNKLVFILGSPGSGKLTRLKEQLKMLRGNNGELLIYNEKHPPKGNVFIADMILISTQAGEDDPDWKQCKKEALNGYSLLIINHFEYNIKDVKANRIKLDFLESVMQKDKSKVIIISTVHPLTFLDSLNEHQGNPIPESELERWQVLLGHFRIVIKPLEDTSSRSDKLMEQIIKEETQYSHYLNDMQKMTLDIAHSIHSNDMDLLSDSIIFKLQITSHYFYTYIWQSLTREEKFLLYDLAEDGLVNPYDDYNLSMLLNKGLIIKFDGTLMLFNRGFRNFILTAIGNTEVNRLKDQVKDNGNWGSLKTPLILAMLAILVFLITSQQEAYTRIITYITALGAGVPVILRIFSLFGNNDNNAQKTS
jgi:hypothetical protein